MKITITQDKIKIETGDEELPFDDEFGIDWSCRLKAHEVCAWGIKRLSEELEKSVQFYRTGKHTDSIVID